MSKKNKWVDVLSGHQPSTIGVDLRELPHGDYEATLASSKVKVSIAGRPITLTLREKFSGTGRAIVHVPRFKGDTTKSQNVLVELIS